MHAAPLDTTRHHVLHGQVPFVSHKRHAGVYTTDTPYTTMNLERLDP